MGALHFDLGEEPLKQVEKSEFGSLLHSVPISRPYNPNFKAAALSTSSGVSSFLKFENEKRRQAPRAQNKDMTVSSRSTCEYILDLGLLGSVLAPLVLL